MKHYETTLEVTLRLALLTVTALGGSAIAEPPGAPPGAPPGGQLPIAATLLNSPCNAYEAASKRLALQVATITAQSGITMSPEVAGSLIDGVKAGFLQVQGALIDCWAAEKAYLENANANRGSPQQAATDRYNTAKERARATLASLPARSPGESAFDATLNAYLSGFYDSKLSRLASQENLTSVKGLHDRLREAFAELVRLSVGCRVANRTSGVIECEHLEDRAEELGDLLDAKIAEASPRVRELTDAEKAGIARWRSLVSQLDATVAALNANRAQAEAYDRKLKELDFWAKFSKQHYDAHLYWYYYHIGVANYCAAVRYWYGYQVHLNAAIFNGHCANYWMSIHRAVVNSYIPAYASGLAWLINNGQRLEAVAKALDQQAMRELVAVYATRALIIALPVSQL